MPTHEKLVTAFRAIVQYLYEKERSEMQRDYLQSIDQALMKQDHSDVQVLEEMRLFINGMQQKGSSINEALLVRFLSTRIPADKIEKLIHIATITKIWNRETK